MLKDTRKVAITSFHHITAVPTEIEMEPEKRYNMIGENSVLILFILLVGDQLKNTQGFNLEFILLDIEKTISKIHETYF